jgi:chromosome segregation ATPase
VVDKSVFDQSHRYVVVDVTVWKWSDVDGRKMMPDFTDLDERIALKKALREAQETVETFRASMYALEERVAQLIKERDEAREDALEQVRERNDARAQLRWEQGVGRQLTRQRDGAQEAAEEYWEAWQDAATYWKQEVARLEAEVNQQKEWRREDREEMQRLLHQRDEAWQVIEPLTVERDRLREALKRYGAHHRDCPLSDSIARLRGTEACSCGLDEASEMMNG